MVEILKSLFSKILDFIFPKEKNVLYLENLAKQNSLLKLPEGFIDEPSFAEVVFDYSDPKVRTLVWAIKYKGNKVLADAVGSILYERIIGKFGEDSISLDKNSFVLIPIPISKERRNERGFNQSELVCDGIIKNDSEKIFEYLPSVLLRNRNTPPQTKLKKKDRLKNLEGCFSVRNPEKISRKNILLIDDVSTTGSTFKEARKTLLSAGAKKIWAFAVAH